MRTPKQYAYCVGCYASFSTARAFKKHIKICLKYKKRING